MARIKPYRLAYRDFIGLERGRLTWPLSAVVSWLIARAEIVVRCDAARAARPVRDGQGDWSRNFELRMRIRPNLAARALHSLTGTSLPDTAPTPRPT